MAGYGNARYRESERPAAGGLALRHAQDCAGAHFGRNGVRPSKGRSQRRTAGRPGAGYRETEHRPAGCAIPWDSQTAKRRPPQTVSLVTARRGGPKKRTHRKANRFPRREIRRWTARKMTPSSQKKKQSHRGFGETWQDRQDQARGEPCRVSLIQAKPPNHNGRTMAIAAHALEACGPARYNRPSQIGRRIRTGHRTTGWPRNAAMARRAPGRKARPAAGQGSATERGGLPVRTGRSN